MIKWIKWFFFSSKKPITEEHIDFYGKILSLEAKYNALLLDVKRLEEENIETNNVLYELSNSLDAVDSRIDILTAEKWMKDDV